MPTDRAESSVQSESTARNPERDAVVYQIYPRSFNDSDGDGVGDLPGIVEKLDYLDDLAVDVVWLNPVYDSPLVDNGYDVRDYRSILPEYGDLSDWEALRDGLHERDIRLLMDFVPNHTSNEHEWFRRSRRGEDPYRDYYVWREGDPDEPPNNWTSFFGGPAWTYDDERGAWYLHLFDPYQPDLDWRNPAVREELYDAMRFWLEKGADGFRLDVVNVISKPADLPDGDPEASLTGAEHFISGPNVHEYVGEMADVFEEYGAMSVGETYDVDPEEARRFVVEDGLDMVFPFDHMHIDEGEAGPWDILDWDLAELKAVTDRWQRGVGEGWIGMYLNNHDQPRSVSRFGDDGEYRIESATMLATYLFTLRGTPFVYQGEEIGMTNAPFESLDEYRDVATIRKVESALGGDDATFEEIADAVNYWSRDNSRTPMQWSDEEYAGFTDGEPWIKVNPNYDEINVRRDGERDRSIRRYYRRLIDLRRERPVLVDGEYTPLLDDHPEIFAYLRERGDDRALAVLNFFAGEPTFERPDAIGSDATLLLGNYPDRDGAAGLSGVADGTAADGTGTADDSDPVSDAGDLPDRFDLRPYEALVYRL